MKSVEAYTALELAEGSAPYVSLMEKAATEAQSDIITLNGARNLYKAGSPGLLTQTMAAWFARYVAQPRSKAIQEMKAAFESDSRSEGGAAGVYLENKRDTSYQKSIDGAIERSRAFISANSQKVLAHEEVAESFRQMQVRMGREPVRMKKWLYVLCLLGVVLLEAFINFESFLKVPYITSPFLAFGATMAVGLGVGIAAHVHGIVFRQWTYRFTAQEAAEGGLRSRRREGVQYFAIGTFALLLALAMVGGARYYYLRDYILQSAILGIAAPSMFGGVIFMLLGNVVAYVIGGIVSFNMHDPNPLFAELDQKLRKSTAAIDALKKERRAVQQDLEDGLHAEMKSSANQETTARGPRYDELRVWADQIVNKDQQVLGLLIEYRDALLRELGPRGRSRIFKYPDGAYKELLPTNLDLVLSGDEFASLPLSLGYDI